MKKLQLIILCPFFISIVLSCVHKTEYEQSSLLNWNNFTAQHLVGSVLEFDDLVLQPNELILLDTLLITNNSATDKFFHIFNLKNKKKVGERVSIGQGPNEMIIPYFVKNKDNIIVYDVATSTVFNYSIEEFINNPDPIPSQKITLEEKIVSGITMLNGEFVGSPHMANAPFSLFDKEGKKKRFFGSYPESEGMYSDTETINMYRSVVTTNQTDRVIVCYLFTDLVDIYNKDGELLKRIHGPEKFTSVFEEIRNENVTFARGVKGKYRYAYNSPIISDNNIFVTFNGKNVGEGEHSLLAEHILVFDLDGNPQKILYLDQGVSHIAVDGRNKKIYGISDNPEYHIVEFSYE